jgi:hypothetical protein
LERHHWTDAQFEEMSWHDNHVHALEVRDGEHGAGEFLLGLGYILECLPPEDGRYFFLIAPARLHFRNVTNLRFAVDWATPSAALCPFSLAGITREAHEYTESMGTHRYAIEINWPEGAISFVSGGFEQTLTGAVVRAGEQFLTYEERRRAQEGGFT